MMERIDPTAAGWESITAEAVKVYGSQEPLHWGTLISYRIGGNDPLDGISAYRSDGPPLHWHFVTYGFSELYEKESDIKEQSGWGFELTFRLARKPDEQQPPVWALSFLQNLARYVFGSGNPLSAGDHMDLNGPIALGHTTEIQAILFIADPQLPAITTPNGNMLFLQVVGITLDELEAALGWRTEGILDLMCQTNPLLVTDLSRRSILSDGQILRKVQERSRIDGSNTGMLFVTQLGFDPGSVSGGPLKLVFGAKAVGTLKSAIPNRLLHRQDLTLLGGKCQARLQSGPEFLWRVQENELHIQLPDQAVEALASSLKPLRGQYPISHASGLIVEVIPTEIKDHEGKVASVIG